MRIELAGMPGCGKSTLLKGLMAAPGAGGSGPVVGIESFAARARRGRAIRMDTVRMLRRKPERAEIYALARFAAENPAIFAALQDGARDAPDRMVWTMLFMANTWFADAAPPRGPVVQDEGFVQYGMAALEAAPAEAVRRYADVIPLPALTILPVIGVEAVLARTARDGNRLPADLRGLEPAALERAFHARAGVLEEICAVLGARGGAVLRLDATAPAQDVLRQAARAVRALMTGAGPGPEAGAGTGALSPPSGTG